MKIVLLDDVASLGQRFEVKNVAAGYARNFLLPRGFAALADEPTLKRVEQLRKKHGVDLARRRTAAAEAIDRLNGTVITFEVKANDQGHLFEGIDQAAVVLAVNRQTKIKLEPDWIELERPIKAVGDYDLAITTGETKGAIKLRVKPI